MSKKMEPALVTEAPQRQRPVQVRLRHNPPGPAKHYPRDGQTKLWWARLMKALGTSSSDFVTASLLQLQQAARLPRGGISEIAMNAALAIIEAAEARNEIEGALAVQMACTHTASLCVLEQLTQGATERRVVAFASAAARLLRAYTMQVEALRRLRHGSSQHVRVEHVHINQGGQAVIGNVQPRSESGGQ